MFTILVILRTPILLVATNLIRRLSFHPDIKPAMKKNHTLIKHLKKTASEPKTELTEAAYGCLLNLGEETKIEDINVQIDQDGIYIRNFLSCVQNHLVSIAKEMS